MITGTLSSNKTDTRVGYRIIVRKAKMHKEAHPSCGESCLQSKRQDDTDNAKKFIKARQDLKWTHDMNTLRRSESNGIAERERELFEEYKKERQQRWFKVGYPKNGGTTRWNVIATTGTWDDKVADGKPACEKICGVQFRIQFYTHLFQRRVSVAPVWKEDFDQKKRRQCLTGGRRIVR